MKKIFMIAKSFAETPDGVSDYIRNLLEATNAQVIQYTVLASEQHEEEKKSIHKFVSDATCWGIFSFMRLPSHLRRSECQTVNLQYVPQIYTRLGISFSLLTAIFIMRYVDKVRVTISFHEVYEPYFRAKPWRWPVALLQRIQFHLLVMFAAHSIFTTPVHKTRVLRYFPSLKSKMSYVPVFSNLKVKLISEKEKISLREKFQIEKGNLVLGLMAKTLHAGLGIEKMIETASLLNQKSMGSEIILMGALADTDADYREDLERQARQRGVKLHWTGTLKHEELSADYQLLDYYFYLLEGGISPRSSAMMAALQHGIPVIALDSWQMDDFVQFKSLFLAVNPLSAEAIVQMIMQTQAEKEELLDLKEKEKKFYQEHFEPKTIVSQIESRLYV